MKTKFEIEIRETGYGDCEPDNWNRPSDSLKDTIGYILCQDDWEYKTFNIKVSKKLTTPEERKEAKSFNEKFKNFVEIHKLQSKIQQAWSDYHRLKSIIDPSESEKQWAERRRIEDTNEYNRLKKELIGVEGWEVITKKGVDWDDGF